MKQLTQDNFDPFQPLAIAVARLTKDLEKQRPQTERDKTPDCEIERKREQQRYVETRMREIRRFERRYRSGQNRT